MWIKKDRKGGCIENTKEKHKDRDEDVLEKSAKVKWKVRMTSDFRKPEDASINVYQFDWYIVVSRMVKHTFWISRMVKHIEKKLIATTV